MEIIRGAISTVPVASRIHLEVDRATLAKRRWRAVAADGREFGFDLEHPLADGAVFFQEDGKVYVIAQKPEAVLELPLGDAAVAARLGWMIGNLHFPIEVGERAAFTVDDGAVRNLFERENIRFAVVPKVFRPVKATAMPHGHHH